MNKYSVTIIGLGNIGMLYDYNNLKNDVFLSHFKSFDFHNSFKVKNIVDSDKNKLLKAKKKFRGKINSYEDFNEIKEITDIVVLSSIYDINLMIFKKLKSNKKIKFFFIEKPFWDKSNVFSKDDLNDARFYINYFRKSLPFFRNFKKKISDKIFGDVLGIHAYYSKGLRNNGSHIIDLINYLFGDNYDLNSIKIIDIVDDYIKNDKSISFSINFKYNKNHFPVIFQAANENHFSIIEIDIIFSKKRFRIFDFGSKVEVYDISKDLLFPNYNNIISKNIIKTDFEKYGLHNCNLIFDILNNNEKNNSKLICDKKNNDIIEKVIKSSKI